MIKAHDSPESAAIDLFFPFDRERIASLHHSALGPCLEKTSVVIDLFFALIEAGHWVLV